MGERNQTLDQRQALLQRRNQRHQSLVSRGHVTAVELEALQEQELQIQSDRQTMSIEQLRQQALVQALRSELDRLQDETANTEDQIRLQLSDLAQQMAQLRGNRAYVLKASVAGTVSNIQLHEGQRARRNVALLQLVPAHSKLLAQLLVPVRAGGFLHSGQVLLIRYDAFPYQKFGSYYGVIESVASTAAMPGDSSDLPFNLSEPVYRVTASLKRHTVRAYGEDFALKSGMTLSADIKLEQRSLLQWLLEPLFSLSGRLV